MAVENRIDEVVAGRLTDEEFDANVRRVVRTLMANRELDKESLGQLLGIGRSAAYSRLASRDPSRFSAAEIKRMAEEIFDVPVDVFFKPAEELLPASAGRTRCFALAGEDILGQLELFDDGGTEWNQRAELVVAS